MKTKQVNNPINQNNKANEILMELLYVLETFDRQYSLPDHNDKEIFIKAINQNYSSNLNFLLIEIIGFTKSEFLLENHRSYIMKKLSQIQQLKNQSSYIYLDDNRFKSLSEGLGLITETKNALIKEAIQEISSNILNKMQTIAKRT